MITVKATVASRPSKVQNNNEDNFYFDGKYNTPEFAGVITTHSYNDYESGPQILAVFDGFGAEKSGGTASFLAAQLLKKFHKIINEKIGNDKSRFFNKYINDAHILIKDKMKEQFGNRMGTTLSLLCIDNDKAFMFGIGDSRVYLYRDGTLKVLSEDHTQAQRMVNLGILKPEKARTHPQKEKLTQYLGILPDKILISPWHQEMNILLDDIFIVCTDGMYDSIDEFRLSQLMDIAREPEKIVEYIIGEAFGKGGKDDVTVIVAKAYGDKTKNVVATPKEEHFESSNSITNATRKTRRVRKPANKTIWQTLTVFLLSLVFMITLSGFGFARYREYKLSLGDSSNKGVFGQNNSGGSNNIFGEFKNNELDDIGNYPRSNDSQDNTQYTTKAPVMPSGTQMIIDTPKPTNTNGTPSKTSTNSPSVSSISSPTSTKTEPTAYPEVTIDPLLR